MRGGGGFYRVPIWHCFEGRLAGRMRQGVEVVYLVWIGVEKEEKGDGNYASLGRASQQTQCRCVHCIERIEAGLQVYPFLIDKEVLEQ